MVLSLETIRPYRALTISLLCASAGCVLMVAARFLVMGGTRYGSLIWNLFLAWIPFVMSLGVALMAASRGTRPVGIARAVFWVAWLLFFPNAPYILTDFIHLIYSPPESTPRIAWITFNALLWYDIILTAVFAFVGHILGLTSMRILHERIRETRSARVAWLFVAGASLVGGYGIYLGRFRGLNSWNIFTSPVSTAAAAFVDLLNLKAVLFGTIFAFFIFLTYLVIWSLATPYGARNVTE